MIAVLSTTPNPLYSFFVPIVSYCWYKLGVDVLLFTNECNKDKLALYAVENIYIFNSTQNQEATRSQCIRLLAGGFFNPDEILITSDIDMAVFDVSYLQNFREKEAMIIGHDLVDKGQYPMCYAAMTAHSWKRIFHDNYAHELVTERLDKIIGDDVENMRGNHWCKDQETLYNGITKAGINVRLIDRRKSDENRTARNRIDRDGWNYTDSDLNGLIDAHLPRPGYEPENFKKILTLLQRKYPQDDFTWLIEYRNKYVNLYNL